MSWSVSTRSLTRTFTHRLTHSPAHSLSHLFVYSISYCPKVTKLVAISHHYTCWQLSMRTVIFKRHPNAPVPSQSLELGVFGSCQFIWVCPYGLRCVYHSQRCLFRFLAVCLGFGCLFWLLAVGVGLLAAGCWRWAFG